MDFIVIWKSKVIYLKKWIRSIRNYLSILGLLFILYIGSFSINFLRFDDREIVELSVLKEENNRLRNKIDEMEKSLNFSFDKYDYVIGKVVIRDIHNFYKEIIINKGEKDGVKSGMAVVNQEGLIGVVLESKDSTSIVKLLTSEYNVSVSVANTYGNLSMGKITMLDKYSDIKEGDFIYTSGLSNIPSGLLVGKVTSVKMDDNALGKEVKVDLINNKNINYIAILKGEI